MAKNTKAEVSKIPAILKTVQKTKRFRLAVVLSLAAPLAVCAKVWIQQRSGVASTAVSPQQSSIEQSANGSQQNGQSIANGAGSTSKSSNSKTSFEGFTVILPSVVPQHQPKPPEGYDPLADIDRINQNAANAHTRDAFISTLSEGLIALKSKISLKADPEMLMRIGPICSMLERAYAAGSSFQCAAECNRQEFEYLKEVVDVKGPKWHPKKPVASAPESPCVAELIVCNRIEAVFLVQAECGGAPPKEMKATCQAALELAKNMLEVADACDARRASLWNSVGIASWSVGDIAQATDAVNHAYQCIGTPAPLGMETQDRKVVLVNCYMLDAALQAERQNTEQAQMLVDQSAKYISDLGADAHGIIGYVELLIARASKSQVDVTRALDRAAQELSHADDCESCQFNRACVLAKQADLADGLSRAALVDEAATKLVWVLDRMEHDPLQLDIQAIKSDPFLRVIVDQPRVKNALDSFDWRPKQDAPFVPCDLWHIGFPLKAVRFVRL